MNEPTNPTPAIPGTRKPRRGAIDSTARVIGVTAIALAAATGWLAWEVRSSSNAVEASAVTRLSKLGAESAQSKAALTLLQSTLRESQARIHETAIDQVRESCQRHNVIPGIHCANGTIARRYLEQGFRMLTVASDLALLQLGGRAELAAARGLLDRPAVEAAAV